MKYVILILFLIISNNYIFSQISNAVVEIENIDLNLDPVYNGWIYNQDTFVVYKISLVGNLDIIFKSELLIDLIENVSTFVLLSTSTFKSLFSKIVINSTHISI